MAKAWLVDFNKFSISQSSFQVLGHSRIQLCGHYILLSVMNYHELLVQNEFQKQYLIDTI